MGDVIRDEARRRGLDPSAKNTGDVMRALREEKGEAAVAELCLDVVAKSGSEKVVVDGISSVAEVEAFRKSGPVLLVAVHASPERRFELLKERGRSDDPLTHEMFLERDQRELGVGIGEAIALADEAVSNQHASPVKLASELAKVVEQWARNA